MLNVNFKNILILFLHILLHIPTLFIYFIVKKNHSSIIILTNIVLIFYISYGKFFHL